MGARLEPIEKERQIHKCVDSLKLMWIVKRLLHHKLSNTQFMLVIFSFMLGFIFHPLTEEGLMPLQFSYSEQEFDPTPFCLSEKANHLSILWWTISKTDDFLFLYSWNPIFLVIGSGFLRSDLNSTMNFEMLQPRIMYENLNALDFNNKPTIIFYF